MIRAFAILAAILSAQPLAAQWQFRLGARAGAVTTTASAYESGDRPIGFGYGGELWIARGPFAVSPSIDFYEAGDYFPRSVTVLNLDAQYLIRLRADRAWWVALGRSAVGWAGETPHRTVWAPSAGYLHPLGKRQMYLTVRYQNSGKHDGSRTGRFEDLNAVLVMAGFRTSNVLR